MELLHLKNIHFSYPLSNREILCGADLVLIENESIGIIGDTGVGKSTLFMIAIGLLIQQRGNVFVFKEECKTEEDFKIVRSKIGYCFQDPDDQLFAPTVLEDVMFGPLNLGYSNKEVLSIADNILNILNIDYLKQRTTYNLSGGEKRLVSLATVLAMNPLFLLLDEPTVGLDPITQHKFENVLYHTGLTTIIISHDHNFLKRVCNKLFELKNGKIKYNINY